ncbi:MAG TPA: hypothetical protein VK272_02555 [Solirubrobacteraceae bacterium]|nr:hypothetical protein [Solirubrobacteraceae bacterium]
MRFASLAICAIVVVSFLIFVADQSKSASSQQAQKITSRSPITASTSGGGPGSGGASGTHKSGVHQAIDEASEQLTSPFAGVTSGSSSQWLIHSVRLLLALAVYGFGLGYLARVLRVRG